VSNIVPDNDERPVITEEDRVAFVSRTLASQWLNHLKMEPGSITGAITWLEMRNERGFAPNGEESMRFFLPDTKSKRLAILGAVEIYLRHVLS
jgi:hypothetical protein